MTRPRHFLWIVLCCTAVLALTSRDLTGQEEASQKKLKKIESSPAGGLPYRLLMDEQAAAEKPLRLILWMHPTGGSGMEMVEPLAPEFNKRGFALLMVTKKDWSGWNTADARKLMGTTLRDAGKRKGINIQKPILMGFSAGGQMALIMWAQDPAPFGGIILNSAYPLVPVQGEGAGPGQYSLLLPPRHAAVKNVPFYVVVGENDGNSRWWRQSQTEWRKRGVPLKVNFVPEKGHQWLMGGEQAKEMMQWVEDVGSGKTIP
jgi:predicted esterase